MRTFTSEGTFEVKGRGRVFAISADQMPHDLYDPKQLRGGQVMIDGRVYVVTDVETFAIARSLERPYRQGFSLAVKDVQ